MKRILICDSNLELFNSFNKKLSEAEIESVMVNNGKMAQSELFKSKFDSVFLNLEVQNYSSIEILKYIKSKGIKSKIIIVVDSGEVLKRFGLTKSDIRKLGISEILEKPFPASYLIELVTSVKYYQAWRNIKQSDNAGIEEEVQAKDDSFTSIKIDEFFSGNIAIFDIYIRLGKNKFLKVLKKGDFFEQARIDTYKTDKGVEELYFKTKDRSQYINYLNALINKIINNPAISDSAKMNLTKNASEKYIEEVFISGISEDVYEEGISVCDNIWNVLNKSESISKLLKEQTSGEDYEVTHTFLTALYSTVIFSKLGWENKKSREALLFGAFLHDIGKLKLPKNIKNKRTWELTPPEFEEYKLHSKFGLELLEGIPLINEQVKQIVAQHHELIDGQGFPLGLPGGKIFPLAQIVGLADLIANRVLSKSISPKVAMKQIVVEQDIINHYSSVYIKAFISGLVSDE